MLYADDAVLFTSNNKACNIEKDLNLDIIHINRWLNENNLIKNILIVIDRETDEKRFILQEKYIKKFKKYNVKVIHRNRNNGLFKNITSSINYAFKYFRCEDLIIVEDDVLC